MRPLDRAFDRFHDYVPFHPSSGFDMHGPMVAEVLETFGLSDRIAAQTDRRLEGLEAREAEEASPFGEEWRQHLGDREALPRWRATFERRLESSTVPEVLATWIPRLAPGLFAGAYHGLIRLGHGLRAWRRHETPIRRRELAIALSNWASKYVELASAPASPGRTRASEIVGGVDPLRGSWRGGSITETVLGRIDKHPRAADTLDEVRPVEHPEDVGDDLVRTAARVYALHDGHEFALLHGVTGSTAVRYVGEFVGGTAQAKLLAHGVQVLAAVYVTAAAESIDASTAPRALDRDAVIEQALEDGSAHALKLTDAVIRNWRRSSKAVHLRLLPRFFDP